MYQLLGMSELSLMRHQIKFLDPARKAATFAIYKHLLRSWNRWLKQSMH
jgi:hypothetical protein